MQDPWRHVESDDALVADFLAATVEAVTDAGGWLHPDARIVERHGELSLVGAAADGEPLVRLTRSAMVRVGRVTWADSVDRLESLDVPDGIFGAELELLILQTALHNACGKIPRLASDHPLLAPDLPLEVIDAVRVFRPSFRLRQPSPASLLWSTRAFRLDLDGSGTPEPVALPIVDLLNHDHRGGRGTWTGESFDIRASHPTTTDECFLDYGLERDPIGMAVVYGFADVTSNVAHSAPLMVEVPGVGHVRLAAKGRARSGELLAPLVRADGDGTVISHLTFRPGQVESLAEDLRMASGWSAEQCASVVDAVAEANVERLDDLAAAAMASADSSPAARVLRDAALRQRWVVLSASSGGPTTESSSSSLSSGTVG
jgi:hypothetical protein